MRPEPAAAPRPVSRGSGSLARMVSQGGVEALDLLPPYDPDQAVAWSMRLRSQGFDAGVVAEILTQSRLRGQARDKFGTRARSLLFTDTALQQATRSDVARVHAARFLEASCSSVADLGCGIGADSLAFADAGLRVLAVERDGETAVAASHNLSGFPDALVRTASAEEVDVSGFDGLWLDPARREGGRGGPAGTERLFDPEAFSPPLSFARRLADAGHRVGVKLGPGLDHADVPAGVEAQWISHRGSVVEACLWFPGLARPDVSRAALVLDSGADGPATCSELVGGHGAREEAPLGGPGRFLLEPDGAVIRSGLVGELARGSGLWLAHPSIAYLHADRLPESRWDPFFKAFEVVEELPYTLKVWKGYVKSLGVSAVEIKKRGIAETPESMRRSLGLGRGAKGAARGQGAAATFIVTRVGTGARERRVVFHVRRVAAGRPAPD